MPFGLLVTWPCSFQVMPSPVRPLNVMEVNCSIILPHIGASAEEKVVCGMALGWADEAARVNTFQTPREPVEGFTRWLE